MDEISLGIKQERGARAEVLLRDELLTEAFDSLKAEYIRTWATTSVKEQDARERLWMAVNIIGKVQDHLKKMAADGRIATKDLSAIEYLKR